MSALVGPEERPIEAEQAPPSLSDSQRVLIRKEVEGVLDRELVWIRRFGLGLAILVAFLGLHTYEDIGNVVAKAVRERVEARLSEVSATEIRQKLTYTLNRSIVTAHLLSAKRPPDQALPSAPLMPHTAVANSEAASNLSLDDWQRLREWIKDRDLGVRDFEDTILVLGSQDNTRTSQDAREILALMLRHTEGSGYEWMNHDTAKQLLILRNFLRSGLELPAQAAATDGTIGSDLRLAALKYIQAVGDRTAFGKILAIASIAPGDDVQKQALLTAASLNPLGNEIEDIVSRICAIKTNDRSDHLREVAVKLAWIIWDARPLDDDDDRASIRKSIKEASRDTSKRLLAFAADDGGFFVRALGSGLFGIFIRSGKAPYTALEVTRDDFSRLIPYWELLREVAASGNIERFEGLAPRSAELKEFVALNLSLTSTSGIVVFPSRSVDMHDTSSVTLIWTEEEAEHVRDWHLTAVWNNRLGLPQKSRLVGLKGSDFQFSLPPH